MPNTVAALYVDPDGPYPSMPGVDAWPVERDARLYRGPLPVVAHPPCASWGNYRTNRMVMCDGHEWDGPRFDRSGAEMICGVAAVHQVRRFGGVLEHPRQSALWPFAGLPLPGCFPDSHGGFTFEVNQGAYGHLAPKLTWIYCVGVDIESITIRPPVDPGRRVESLSAQQRILTPPAFAEFLVSIARSAAKPAGSLVDVSV